MKKILDQKILIWKNFGSGNLVGSFQIFFVRNFVLSEKDFWSQKIFGQQFFLSEKIFGPKMFGSKKIVGPKKNFGPKKIIGRKKMLVQSNFLVQKNVWSEKNLGLKQILSPKQCFWPENFGSEKFVQKNFVSKKSLCSKNFVPKKNWCPTNFVIKKMMGQIANMDKSCLDCWHLLKIVPGTYLLKFGQNEESNICYISDMDKCHQDKCCQDKCHGDSWNLL